MVNMKLGNHIADGGDVQLVRLKLGLEDLGDQVRLHDKADLIVFFKLIGFGDAGPPWDQKDPWILTVVHQKEGA